ncbi:hypothetical protein LY90DRAFT_516710 [Neocallimastix californiae]|uniref:Uncharacterized protein n=1 Tax=Neocallimastix californiae TaxID=1754190 RepID=A0A1Y2AD94_9FUNG|nr:hypothetical protein LY90DRAFT_516710 [Neocallimastix californiae]|eukprot:ORY20518.1 hypothetical protein LY90DRAFT_516710 [Neocallimastix californiae]
MDFSNVPIELLEVSNYLQKIMKKKVGNFNADKAIYFYVKTLAFIIGIIGLFFLVRFLVFKVTQRIGQKSGRHGGLMILPELFADCTFREKFIPLYQFSETKLQKLE